MANHLIKIWYSDSRFEQREFSHLSDAYARYMDLAKERAATGDISVLTLVSGLSGAVLHSIPGDV